MPEFKTLQQKAPDFSRHENCSQEQFIDSKVLFKAEDSFDAAWAKEQEETESDLWVNLYMKVGLYCRWDWETFYYKTPYRVIKIINKKIDRKFETLDDSSTWLNYEMISTAMAISRCFGGGSES